MSEIQPYKLNPATRRALVDLQAFKQLTYYPSRDVWGGGEHHTESVQSLVRRGLAWCGPLAAYPTARGLVYAKRATARGLDAGLQPA